jgi:hypothetical protein
MGLKGTIMKTVSLAMIIIFTLPLLSPLMAAQAREDVYDIAPTFFIARQYSPFSDVGLQPAAVNESRSWARTGLNLEPRIIDPEPAQTYFTNAKITDNSFGNNIFNASMVSFVGLNVADYFTTKAALRYMGVNEGNPLLKNIVRDPTKFAVFKLGITAFSYWNMKSLYNKKNKTLAWIFSLASNALMYYVVSCNIDVINKATAR